ncbi:NACHT domain-containing protein [Kitasatospora sp. NPDC090091]|uniref:NACHT domain-containing protein n=1 Tax=Kitasatospora sp. NPDC090091 TaxID=3364081 RepID=UPI0038122BD5
MSSETREPGGPGGKVDPRSAPRLVRPRRAVRRAVGRTRRALRVHYLRWLARRKVVKVRYPATWSSWRKRLTSIPAVAFLAFIGWSAYIFARGNKGWFENRCSESGACGVLLGFITPFLSLALAAFVFLVYRRQRIRAPIVRKARRAPHKLVPTAHTAVDQVVGREQLCEVICRSLDDHAGRRPYVLVGSVGAGKTAVLVQLTHMLARQHRVPVPVRLRDIDKDGAELDFRELARKRFAEEADPGSFLSSEQTAKVWRQLCEDGQAVVLADGLEEAMASNGNSRDRDNAIRNAIKKAKRQNLPLVIASRPHAPLEATVASIIDLEPLSEEAALDFLARDDPQPDTKRLDWIVETAVVSESPLYMEIARELGRHRQLTHLDKDRAGSRLDTRSRDRSKLRLGLLSSWETALVDGHLRDEVALTAEERRDTVDVISMLAALGLLGDRLEVDFADLLGGPGGRDDPARILRRKLTGINASVTADCESVLALHATRGELLGLVETRGERVRFPHSIVQAYLGSRHLDRLWPAVGNALRSDQLGRELLIALVLRAANGCDAPAQTARCSSELAVAARSRTDPKALDLFAAALEVDLHAQQACPTARISEHRSIAQQVNDRWLKIHSQDRRTLDEARERLVHRFGEILREISRLQEDGRWPTDVAPAYEEFFEIAIKERSYSLRLAVTQEIGAGGDPAFHAVRELARAHDAEDKDPVAAYRKKMDVERDREHAASDASVGRGGDPKQRRQRYAEDEVKRAYEAKQAIWREYATRAWLIPMLVGSVSIERRADAQERLNAWLGHLDPANAHGRADLPLSFEVALAQGFKRAANRRLRHPHTNNETRGFLIAQAESMLARSRFWFSQLTLIHALCLWELPDRSGPVSDDEHEADEQSPPIADAPRAAVQRWLRLAGSERAPADRRPEDQSRHDTRERLHPFVARAAHLAVLALETGRPEQYIWIDEKGAMEKVGSDSGDPRFYRRHNLWIPPSVGWSTLDPRAQQLLADVLLLLNLAERCGEPDEVEGRLERARRNSLPPCLTDDRAPLQPGHTVGRAKYAEPGSTCPRDCPFELCPYPPKGELPRAELTEVFCLQQQALVRWRRGSFYALTRKRAPWQGMTGKDLQLFWSGMAARTRTPEPRPVVKPRSAQRLHRERQKNH